jgi:hypothetical protein
VDRIGTTAGRLVEEEVAKAIQAIYVHGGRAMMGTLHKPNTVMMDQKAGGSGGGYLVRKRLVLGCGTEGMIKGAGLP